MIFSFFGAFASFVFVYGIFLEVYFFLCWSRGPDFCLQQHSESFSKSRIEHHCNTLCNQKRLLCCTLFSCSLSLLPYSKSTSLSYLRTIQQKHKLFITLNITKNIKKQENTKNTRKNKKKTRNTRKKQEKTRNTRKHKNNTKRKPLFKREPPPYSSLQPTCQAPIAQLAFGARPTSVVATDLRLRPLVRFLESLLGRFLSAKQRK